MSDKPPDGAPPADKPPDDKPPDDKPPAEAARAPARPSSSDVRERAAPATSIVIADEDAAAAATLPAPDLPAPPAPPPPQQVMIDPAAAAFEAARIAGEIVGDIANAGNAAIIAAAAAGAAIEATRARSSIAPQNVANAPATDAPPATDPTSPHDPVVTVRMQRDRILRALAEDIASSPEVADAAAAAPPREPGASGGRASSVTEDEDERDPVEVAALAIQRLRQRASTDFAELRTHYHRHDVVVLLAAFVVILVAGAVHTRLVTPETTEFPGTRDELAQRGLSFEYPRGWLPSEQLPTWPPRIVRDPTGQAPKSDDAYHVSMTSSVDPSTRIEVLIEPKPAWTNVITSLELDRRTRWGELYSVDDSAVIAIGDQDWLRTRYRFANAPEKGDVPRIDAAIEYATVDREQAYVVTLFGSPRALEELDGTVAETLKIAARPGTRSAQRLGTTRTRAGRKYPSAVDKAADSTVMIVVADLVDGRLRARGGGSGVIVGGDGSILTSYHVIHDKNGRLHDVFVIGRSSSLDRAPQLVCAGRPNRSKIQRELDLALIKCDTDLDGRTWLPAASGVWPTLPETRPADIKIGQRIWVLGYPEVGGGGLTVSPGAVEGWTGQDGREGREFIKVDAAISHGNSGGPVIDDTGRLVGIASLLRTKTLAGTAITTQEKLVRPIGTASDLLAIAAIGWTPREGRTEVEIQPAAVEAPAEGVRIETIVIDAASEAPVRDALVMVLRPGMSAAQIDVNRLDDQVIAWGRSNTQGEVKLSQPVPVGTYTVLVRATGYEPLIGEDKLRIEESSPPRYDPWGSIKLLAR